MQQQQQQQQQQQAGNKTPQLVTSKHTCVSEHLYK